MSASPDDLPSARRAPRFSKLSARFAHSLLALALFGAPAAVIRASAAFANSSSTLLCETLEQRCENQGRMYSLLPAQPTFASSYTPSSCQANLMIATQSNGQWPAMPDGTASLSCNPSTSSPSSN